MGALIEKKSEVKIDLHIMKQIWIIQDIWQLLVGFLENF